MSSIMPACHTAVVITQGIKFINLALGAFFVCHIICQIKIMNWEVNKGFQFMLC